jgi:hypothetical protein
VLADRARATAESRLTFGTDPIRVGSDTRVVRFSPRLHEYIVGRIGAHDDGRRAMAEIWRRAARDAEEVGLSAPGYHSVRAVVRAERERRAAQKEALLIALEESLRWAPDGLRIVDHLAAAVRLRRPGGLLSVEMRSGRRAGLSGG